MSQWDNLNNMVASNNWKYLPESQPEKLSVIATANAWKLKNWQQMEVYVESISQNTFNGAFYRAILNIHKENYDFGQKVCMSKGTVKLYSVLLKTFIIVIHTVY